MKCPNCNFEIAENTKFCPECGNALIINDPELVNKLNSIKN